MLLLFGGIFEVEYDYCVGVIGVINMPLVSRLRLR